MNINSILLTDEDFVGTFAEGIYKLNSGQQLFLIFLLVIAAIALFFFFKNFWNILDFITDKIRAVKRKYKS